jgi:putative ABC transport system ATP-binding protein
MVADLAALERLASERAAARAGGADRLQGHIVCEGLVRIFKSEGVEVVALQGLELTVDRGDLLAIVGASGSGKSTLLSILSGLDSPTAGLATVAGHDLLTMSRRERLRYHRRTVGFVRQQTTHNLLPYLTAAENVELPMRLAGRRGRGAARRARTRELLELVGIGDAGATRPDRLSGGELQRVAVAVALANDPEVLFADEPTGELDEATAASVFAALQTVNAELGVTVVVVTHDHTVVDQVRRTVAIRDGRIASELRRSSVSPTAAAEEYTTLDRSGRMQLPAAFVEALELRDRVRLKLEPDHVQVRPADREETDE